MTAPPPNSPKRWRPRSAPRTARVVAATAWLAFVVPTLAAGQGVPGRTTGTISANGSVDEGLRPYDARAVSLAAGDEVELTVTSAQFAPGVRVIAPHGERVEITAAPTDTSARVRFAAPSTGRYVIHTTTVTPRAEGDYALTVVRTPSATAPADTSVVPANVGVVDALTRATVPGRRAFVASRASSGVVASNEPPAPAGRTYGVFVGLDHYADGASLEFVVDDIRALATAFIGRGVMQPEDITTLGDHDATVANLRDALLNVTARVRPSDTLVFFFGGHGSDGRMALYDGPMSRADLSFLLGLSAGRTLVALDMCHAGSFASIVDGHAQRVGLFSSRADESSYVARRVRSGGWLDYELIRAIRETSAGANRAVEISELAAFVRRGYARDVGDLQHLVVARGSPHSDLTLWNDDPRGLVR